MHPGPGSTPSWKYKVGDGVVVFSSTVPLFPFQTGSKSGGVVGPGPDPIPSKVIREESDRRDRGKS